MDIAHRTDIYREEAWGEHAVELPLGEELASMPFRDFMAASRHEAEQARADYLKERAAEPDDTCA